MPRHILDLKEMKEFEAEVHLASCGQKRLLLFIQNDQVTYGIYKHNGVDGYVPYEKATTLERAVEIYNEL